MRIEFERAGGFAGMRMAVTVETETLSPEEARELQALLDAAHFFDLPAVMTAPARGADRFIYRLTVEREAQRHTVEMGEAAVPETLQPLVQRLTALARSARGG